ncbi:hypothetical protein MMC31_005160, partial [Peltigera leucophlebia]|nr:hypothetical protein [Peltigera leucophlebia]
MSRFLLWNQIMLLLMVQHTVTTVSSNLEFLAGDGEAQFSTFTPSETGSNAIQHQILRLISDSGEQVINLWNGEQSPELLLLSQSNQCKDEYGQAPIQMRRVRRQKNSVCLPDYGNGPATVQTHKLPAKLKKGSIEQQQDRPGQRTPETPPFIKPVSIPMFGETLVGPGPDPSICKDPDRPIPVCHSGVDAEYSNSLPWIADRLPNCHAI